MTTPSPVRPQSQAEPKRTQRARSLARHANAGGQAGGAVWANGTLPCVIPPQPLLVAPQWIGYRLEVGKKGKPTKKPYNPMTGQLANVVEPSTWGTYDTAVQAIRQFGLSGIGFIFSDQDSFCGIDLDDCRNPETGEIEEWAKSIIARLQSYTEVSPSGTGIHIFVTGNLPPGARCKTKKIEIYSRHRFFTWTGWHLEGTSLTIEARETELAELHRELFPPKRSKAAKGGIVRSARIDGDDDDLLNRIRKSRQGNKFQRLWDGDTSEYQGDHSDADLALCSILAFWTAGDVTRIDRLFRRSRLMREKWDSRRRDSTYGAETVKRACSAVRKTDDNLPETIHGESSGSESELQHPEPITPEISRDSSARGGQESPPERSSSAAAGRMVTTAAGSGTQDRLPESDAATVIEAPDEDWRKHLIRSPNGVIRPLLANAIAALSKAAEWKRVLAFNDFALRVERRHPTPWGSGAGERWSDNDDRRTAEWLQYQGIFVSPAVAGEAVMTVAMDSRFHPVRDYLNSVTGDGKPRLSTFASRYLGADPDKTIANTFSRLWLISAVARIMSPGVKADCCLVLEGPQGILKSTALRILGGEFFTDQISDLGSKDSFMQCHGVWIIEMAELASLSRSESSRIKAFMSSTSDRFRLPYGRNIVEWPRDCVFAGTVNHEAYLHDESGGRRFLPIRCGRIDTEALARDRDLIWAEALIEFRDGKPWWLQDGASIQEAEQEQSDRYQPGQWDELIRDWLNDPAERLDERGHPVAPLTSTRDWVTIPDILNHCIGKSQQHWTRADEMVVSAALKAQGWERKKERIGYDELSGKTLFRWGYRKK
jgi:predicted P-loop ATPase